MYTKGTEHRQKRVGDMLSGQDGQALETPEKTRARAQGPTPPHSAFIILSKLPKGPGFWSLSQHNVNDNVSCACRPQVCWMDSECSGLRPVILRMTLLPGHTLTLGSSDAHTIVPSMRWPGRRGMGWKKGSPLLPSRGIYIFSEDVTLV